MTLSEKQELINIAEQEGKLVIFQFPNGQPYIKKLNGGLVDTDGLDIVMKRAKMNDNLEMAEEMEAPEMANYIEGLISSYGKEVWEAKKKESEKRDAEEKDVHRRSQMFEY